MRGAAGLRRSARGLAVSAAPVTGRVLIVDDDPDIVESIQTILEMEGYAVLTASDGRGALEILRRSEPPDLILLDLMMPGMNGAEFRAEQLRDPALSDIPVVAISGDGRVQAKAAALAVRGLAKPIALDTLLETVKSHCAPHDG